MHEVKLICQPANSSELKIEATKSYGAEITFVQNAADRLSKCTEIARNLGATLIPPFDHRNIILGQGTVMYEFLNQIKEEYQTKLDAVIIPVGGGGLLAGCSTACMNSGTVVFGAEPALADDCFRGKQCGIRQKLQRTPTTIADGLRTEVGEVNFPIIQKFSHLTPIRALFWSAVINGIVAVPIMIVMMLMTVNPKVMGKYAGASPLLQIFGWLATAVMAVATVGLFLTWKS